MPEEREASIIDDVKTATTEAATVETDASTKDANTAAATSTAADEVKSTASIVRDVVAKQANADKAVSSPEGEVKVEETTVQAERDPDDYSDVPFHKHKRFQEVIGKLKDARAETETYKADAQRHKNVQTFLDNNGLSAEEAANGLITFALAKTNPVKAWEQVRPWVEKLAIAAGEFLPKELMDRVQAGEISRDVAFEISRSTAKVASIEGHTKAENDRRVASERNARAEELKTAASSWQADRTEKDPNFAAKMPLLSARLAEIHRDEGVAKNKDGVVDQLKRSYDYANTYFRAPVVSVAKPAIKPVVGANAANLSAVNGAPTSTLDIIKQAVAARAAI